MKIGITLLLFMVTIVVTGQTRFNYQKDFQKILAKTKDPKDSLFYDTQLKRFQSNDTTLTPFEVLALLIGYTAKPEYQPYQDIEIEREIYNLNGEKKYEEGLKAGKKFLSSHPLSLKVLFEMGYSFHKLEKKDSANYYVYQGQRILKAMFFSGNGKTPETPIFALSPADGQDFIHKFVGKKIGSMGSGSDKWGNFLDILEVQMDDTKTLKLYFIIQHATEKMFDEKSIEEELQKQSKKKGKKRN
jgi:hypothetical protein